MMIAVWILVFFAGPNMTDMVNYPAYDYRAFETRAGCEAAKRAMEKGLSPERFRIAPPKDQHGFACVYEPKWEAPVTPR